MLCTRLTEPYGLKVPFVSAGMGFVAVPELVAAVSNAGGLGLLGASPAPPPAMQAMIQATKALTSRPFGVDLIIAETAFGPCATDAHIEVCVTAVAGFPRAAPSRYRPRWGQGWGIRLILC